MWEKTRKDAGLLLNTMLKIVKKTDALLALLSEEEKEELETIICKINKAITLDFLRKDIVNPALIIDLDFEMNRNVREALYHMSVDAGWKISLRPIGSKPMRFSLE